jgi:hypothetical protein
MAQTYIVDPRLPVSPDVKPSDPTHPANIIKRLLETGHQAVADAKYDNKPHRLPQGVESFANPVSNTTITVLAVVILCLAFVVVCNGQRLGLKSHPLVVKFGCIIVIVLILHWFTAKLEKRTV